MTDENGSMFLLNMFLYQPLRILDIEKFTEFIFIFNTITELFS